jgi:hypothetical protein
MDKRETYLEMRLKIETVFEHYAEQSEYYKRSNIAQRFAMEDAELLRYGRAAKSMCSPGAYFGQAPRQVFVVQLAEARAEQERRKVEKEPKT